MEASEKAIGAMQAYLRLKRYILPSGIAREALQAAFIAQPSAARELGLDEAARYHDKEAEYYSTRNGALDGVPFKLIAHFHRLHAAAIRALSSPDHADAGKVEGDGWLQKAGELYDRCKLFPETSAEGFTALLQLRNHVAEILPSAPTSEGAE
ncbi:hypothetical protein [Ochrobactrum sp. RH2CCR150]|uniref:hypothetical protein n=1 Tax=Ochrobactrum sp. RH2CCR150 TaxID=2587044 RepID=UPI0015FDB862|nr:hypothetical protein [Ochrobactrum sp. RH2CCR150]